MSGPRAKTARGRLLIMLALALAACMMLSGCASSKVEEPESGLVYDYLDEATVQYYLDNLDSYSNLSDEELEEIITSGNAPSWYYAVTKVPVIGWAINGIGFLTGVRKAGFMNDKSFMDAVCDSIMTANPLQDLVTTLSDMSNYEALNSFISQICQALGSIGLLIMIIGCIRRLFALSLQDRLTRETTWSTLASLTIGWIVVLNASKIYELMIAFTNGVTAITLNLTSGIYGVSATGASASDNINLTMALFINQVRVSCDTWYERVIYVAAAKVMMVCQTVAFIFILIIVVARVVELSVRACFLPIAMAAMHEGFGTHGPAARYIRKMAALFLQGPCLLLISQVCRSIEYGLLSGYFNSVNTGASTIGALLLLSLGMPIVLAIAQVAVSRGSIHILNDVMEVNGA